MSTSPQASDSVYVALVSTDRALAQELEVALGVQGMRAVQTSLDRAALERLQRPDCALAIVDLPPSSHDADAVLARLDAGTAERRVPMLLLVEHDQALARIGAAVVDVLRKPVSLAALANKARFFAELARREHAVARREHTDAAQEHDVEEALKSLVVRSRALTDNATLGLVLMDARQHCTFMNPAAEKIFGLTLAEVQGGPLHDFVHHTHPDGRPYPMQDCPINRALPTRMQERGEDVFVRPDGTFYPVAFTASPILEDGVAVGTVIELRDATEEKRAQALQERRARCAALMGDVGSALTRGTDQDEVLRACAEAIVSRLGVAVACVWAASEDGRSLTLRAHAGDGLGARPGDTLALEGSAAGSVFTSKQVFRSAAAAHDERLAAAEKPSDLRLEAHTALPLLFEQRASGVLAVYSRQALEPDTVAALGPVTDAIALGSERLRVERARRESEERFRNMANHAPVMLWVTNPSGACTYLNKGWYDFTGQTEETGLGLGWLDAVHPEDAERAGQVFLAANAERAPFRLDYRLLRKDGEYRWAIDSASPRFGPSGEHLGYIGSVIDITERVAAEDEVRRLNASLEAHVRERTAQLERKTAQLEDANRELEAFGYSVSHDLRAPLRHIAGFAQLLERRSRAALDDKAREYLHTIAEAANKGGQLVDALLAFSRLGKTEPRREQVPLTRLVQELRDELQLDLVDRHVTWQVAPLPTVVGDAHLLRAVFKNLLSNALKYSRTRAEAVVEIGTETRADEVELWVRDNGVGFDMAYADKLFGVFQRLHSAEEFDGTGIGLANVRRIVQRHGGRVWAHATVNGGAIFHLTLPRVLPAAPST